MAIAETHSVNFSSFFIVIEMASSHPPPIVDDNTGTDPSSPIATGKVNQPGARSSGSADFDPYSNREYEAAVVGNCQDHPDVDSIKYEYLDHTADVQIHTWGRTTSEAFEQAAVAMFAYMTEIDKVGLQNCCPGHFHVIVVVSPT